MRLQYLPYDIIGEVHREARSDLLRRRFEPLARLDTFARHLDVERSLENLHNPMHRMWLAFFGASLSEAWHDPESLLSQVVKHHRYQTALKYTLITINQRLDSMPVISQRAAFILINLSCRLSSRDNLNQVTGLNEQISEFNYNQQSPRHLNARDQVLDLNPRRATFLIYHKNRWSLTAKQLSTVKDAPICLLDAIGHRGVHESRPHKQSLFFNGSAIDLVSLPLTINDQLTLNGVAKDLSLFSAPDETNHPTSSPH